jgi:hypothetical protein
MPPFAFAIVVAYSKCLEVLVRASMTHTLPCHHPEPPILRAGAPVLRKGASA